MGSLRAPHGLDDAHNVNIFTLLTHMLSSSAAALTVPPEITVGLLAIWPSLSLVESTLPIVVSHVSCSSEKLYILSFLSGQQDRVGPFP